MKKPRQYIYRERESWFVPTHKQVNIRLTLLPIHLGGYKDINNERTKEPYLIIKLSSGHLDQTKEVGLFYLKFLSPWLPLLHS